MFYKPDVSEVMKLDVLKPDILKSDVLWVYHNNWLNVAWSLETASYEQRMATRCTIYTDSPKKRKNFH